MLTELSIRDFAIIESLTIGWQAGLNVLTGETGAGKSIIVDAVGALLGDRLGPEVVRTGRERAYVEGIFVLGNDSAALGPLRDLLLEHGLFEDESQLLLSREIARGGRSVARINGRAVPVSLLQEVGEQLVDVHGQSQHLSLLRVREHLDFLDRYAGLLEFRRALGDLVARWRGTRAERQKIQQEIRAAARERDLLRHEIAEIEAAQLQASEEDDLISQRERLRNAEKLRQTAQLALLAVQGDDEQRGAAELLGRAAGLCAEGGRIDGQLAPLVEGLERLASEADEVARELRSYLQQLEDDPGQLEAIEARFLAVADLKRKYGDSIPAILAYLEQARARLATAERGEEMIEELNERERARREEVGRLASELSARRSRASASLSAAVEGEVRDLNMAAAHVRLALEQQADDDGVDWPAEAGAVRRVAIDSSGADRVEFLFSANPGQTPRGLGRIASGGELARVALALKAVLAQADPRPTLIFDEIDVGVGGRGASVVGQKLCGLTASHQVLCVTHQPQVAAFADQHLVVSKQVRGRSTSVAVEVVDGTARVHELAAMLGGGPGSPAAEANARELLARSQSLKNTGKSKRKAG
jgi:DNA repair protein RecN (Recombination protein N)